MATALRYDFGNRENKTDLMLWSSAEGFNELIGGVTTTISRASTRTVKDHENVLVTVPGEVPAFTGGRFVQNLILRSNEFDTTWTPSTTTLADGFDAPDGSTDAWSMSPTASSSRLNQTLNTLPAGATFTISVYAKAGLNDFLYFRPNSYTVPSNDETFFDLSDGTLGSAGQSDDYGVEAASLTYPGAPAGWYRCWATYTLGTDTAGSMRIGTSDADFIVTTSAKTDAMFIWGAQVEDVSGQSSAEPSEYIATTTAAQSAWYAYTLDGTALNPDGVSVWKSCTNLLLRSQELDEDGAGNPWNAPGDCTIDADAATAPDGTMTADRINVTPGTGLDVRLGQPANFTNTRHALSVFVKSDGASHAGMQWINASEQFISVLVNLSTGAVVSTDVGSSAGTIDYTEVEEYADGWYRIKMVGIVGLDTSGVFVVFTGDTDSPTWSSVGRPNYDPVAGEDAFFWGAQVEQDRRFVGPYIKTEGSTVTTNGDNILSNDNSWLDSSGWGSWYVDATYGEYERGNGTDDPAAVTLNATGQVTRIGEMVNEGPSIWVRNFPHAGSNAATMIGPGPTFSAGDRMRLAVRFAENDAYAIANGSDAKTDTTVDAGDYSASFAFRIGYNSYSGGGFWCEDIKEIIYDTDELTDSELDDWSNGIGLPVSDTPGTVWTDEEAALYRRKRARLVQRYRRR